jgi:hypothetical protein
LHMSSPRKGVVECFLPSTATLRPKSPPVNPIRRLMRGDWSSYFGRKIASTVAKKS